MGKKSGKAGSPVSPAAPDAAEDADIADPGKMAEIKAEQVEKKEGKYGSEQVKPHKPPSDEEVTEEMHWIEIELFEVVNKKEIPVPGEKYKITLPDGKTVAESTLDNNGFARVDGIKDPGNCQITFPDLDKGAWEIVNAIP